MAEPADIPETPVQTGEMDLVRRAQKGDLEAYDELIKRYQERIYATIYHMTSNHEDANDLAQESFIKAFQALKSFKGGSSFYTWLYRIGINTAKNYLLALKRRAPTSTQFDADESEGFEDAGLLQEVSTPENELMSKQVVEVVNSSLQQLPDDLRTALTLREIEGLSYEEIADVMNCPIGTVRSRIFRAREAIAENLRPLLGTSEENRW